MNDRPESLTVHPIGYIRTPYRAKSEAPHPPDPAERVEGRIELLPGQNFEQALEDLDGMEKIWLLYWFDRNPNWKPKVLVPRGPAKKRGLFATRSPHRPNPIGLTLVDLVRVDGLTLYVQNVDLLDGTPILDIKPYLPALEAYPDARAGWIDDVESRSSEPSYQIELLQRAQDQLTFLEALGIPLRQHVVRILEHFVDVHPYKRIEKDRNGLYIAYRAWRVRFSVAGNTVTLTEVRSGYPKEKFDSDELLADDNAQRTFLHEYPDACWS